MEKENTSENENFRMKKKKKRSKKKKKITLMLIKVLLVLIKNELHDLQNINNHKVKRSKLWQKLSHMSINTGLHLKNKFARQTISV